MTSACLPTLSVPGARSQKEDSIRHEALEPLTVRRQAPCLTSDSLLQGQSSVSIEHKGAVYRLQATKLGKLILTK